MPANQSPTLSSIGGLALADVEQAQEPSRACIHHRGLGRVGFEAKLSGARLAGRRR